MCNKRPREPMCQNLIKSIKLKLNELEFQLAITQQVLKIKIWN